MSSKNKIAQRKKFEKWCRRCNLYTATHTQANPKHPNQAQIIPQIVPACCYLCHMNEHQIQAQIVAYWNENYPQYRKCLFHVNNKAKDSLEGARMKTLGVVSGVSDLILIAPNQVYFLELKDSTGRQSDHQKAFQQQATSLNHIYLIIRSLDEFKALLSSINY